MNILKTDIIDPVYDVLWNEIRSLAPDAVSRPVLVLVNDSGNGNAGDIQLQKMLAACKLFPEHYNTLKLGEGQLTSWPKLRERLDPKVIFLIGIAPAQLGISALFHLNNPNNFDGRIWLPTLSISELEKHDDMKKQLWTSGMKPVFVDKSYGVL